MALMLPPLTDVHFLKQHLHTQGMTPSRLSGQNFLICDEPLEAVVSALDEATLHITELGAGIGPLTQALLASGYTVRAIERDAILAALHEQFLPKRLRERHTLVTADLRETSWSWKEPYQLVGNIPYNLSGLILRHTTQLDPAPTQAIFMVQQEVAARLVARVPNMNLLALSVQLWGSVHPLLHVPPHCFWPQPEVTSQLILLLPAAEAPATTRREAILALAKPFFQQRRKQMVGVLKRLVGVTAEESAALLATVNASPTVRPQELTVAQWQALYTVLEQRQLLSA